MQRVSVELIPDSEFGGYTARPPDIPADGQGETEQAAIDDLKEAIWVTTKRSESRDSHSTDKLSAD